MVPQFGNPVLQGGLYPKVVFCDEPSNIDLGRPGKQYAVRIEQEDLATIVTQLNQAQYGLMRSVGAPLRSP